MKGYREFQFSGLMVVILVAVQAVITIFFISGAGTNPISLQGFLIMTAFFLLVMLIFYGMTTVISDGYVRLKFGIGLIRKKISLENVSSVEVVKNPWYYGYGIRWIPNGWLYNASGVQGVELRFHHRKGVIRIGTKHPVRLKEAIQGNLKR